MIESSAQHFCSVSEALLAQFCGQTGRAVFIMAVMVQETEAACLHPKASQQAEGIPARTGQAVPNRVQPQQPLPSAKPTSQRPQNLPSSTTGRRQRIEINELMGIISHLNRTIPCSTGSRPSHNTKCSQSNFNSPKLGVGSSL